MTTQGSHPERSTAAETDVTDTARGSLTPPGQRRSSLPSRLMQPTASSLAAAVPASGGCGKRTPPRPTLPPWNPGGNTTPRRTTTPPRAMPSKALPRTSASTLPRASVAPAAWAWDSEEHDPDEQSVAARMSGISISPHVPAFSGPSPLLRGSNGTSKTPSPRAALSSREYQCAHSPQEQGTDVASSQSAQLQQRLQAAASAAYTSTELRRTHGSVPLAAVVSTTPQYSRSAPSRPRVTPPPHGAMDTSSTAQQSTLANAGSASTSSKVRARTPPPVTMGCAAAGGTSDAAAAIAAALFAAREDNENSKKSERTRRQQDQQHLQQSSKSEAASLHGQRPCDSEEEFCQRWEAWAHAIARAVEESAELPEPPRPPADGAGMSPAFLRVLEASTLAAAALARSSAEAEGLRIVSNSLDVELARSRADVRRLQTALNEVAEDRAKTEKAMRGHCDELRASAASADEEVRRLRRQSVDLQCSIERMQAEMATERRCARCDAAQRRIAEISEEAERAKSALQDTEALRQKEIEDAWCVAEAAETKQRHTLAVLRDLLTAQGNQGGHRDGGPPQSSLLEGPSCKASAALYDDSAGLPRTVGASTDDRMDVHATPKSAFAVIPRKAQLDGQRLQVDEVYSGRDDAIGEGSWYKRGNVHLVPAHPGAASEGDMARDMYGHSEVDEEDDHFQREEDESLQEGTQFEDQSEEEQGNDADEESEMDARDEHGFVQAAVPPVHSVDQEQPSHTELTALPAGRKPYDQGTCRTPSTVAPSTPAVTSPAPSVATSATSARASLRRQTRASTAHYGGNALMPAALKTVLSTTSGKVE